MRTRTVQLALLMLVAAVTATSCANVMCGRTELVEINSVPSGEKVVVDGVEHVTPVKLELSRRDEHRVIGPKGQQVRIRVKTNPWVLASLVLGIVPFAIDCLMGSAGDLDPDKITFFGKKAFRGDLEIPQIRPDPEADR